MRMRRIFLFAIVNISTVLLAAAPGVAENGLSLVVLDKNNRGIESEIYARISAVEIKLGKTDHDGKFFDNNYHCSGVDK